MKSGASSAVIEVEWQRFRQANQAVGPKSLEKGNKHPHTKYRRQIEPDKKRNRWEKKERQRPHEKRLGDHWRESSEMAC
jgi:hypothetical protein